MQDKLQPHERLRELMVSRKLKNAQLARLVTPRTTGQEIGRLVNGGRPITYRWAARIAPVFGLLPEELLGDRRVLLSAEEAALIKAIRAAPKQRRADIVALIVKLVG